jgi:hypothetical protein
VRRAAWLAFAVAWIGGSAPTVARADDAPDTVPKDSVRVAAVGEAHRLADIDVLAGGLDVTLSHEWSGLHGGSIGAFMAGGRTRAGLGVLNIGVPFTYDVRFDWLRLSVGGGLTYLGVWRATTHQPMSAFGVEGLLRAAIDPGGRGGLFVALQADVQGYGASIFWGPTVLLGYRF